MAAEAGAAPPVPAGLINGTWWRGGTQPPLDPSRLIAALQAVIRDPALPEAVLLQTVGRPVSLTDSELTGDFDMLAQGGRTILRESARITRRDSAQPSAPIASPKAPVRSAAPGVVEERAGRAVDLIVHAVPRHLKAPELKDEISALAQRENRREPERRLGLPPSAELRERLAIPALPISAMHYEDTEDDLRLAITLRPEANAERVAAQLASTDVLAVEMVSEFPAPLAELLRAWVATHRNEDIRSSLSQFEAAVRADRLEAQAGWD
ncbi:MAG TPA: hypothetical protein VFQ44_18810 [Streptosporangiaceae bacterium]|nr:hypothetical protein [Streptosporangiaceae bacterium]